MQLSAKMDAGPIYKQVTVTLNDTETTPQLEAQLAELGAQELCHTLPLIMSETLKPVAQDDSIATYCQLLSKDAAILDPSALTAEQAERQVRAFLAFPKTKYTVANQQIVITKAHIASAASSILDIQCVDGQYLSIDELIGPSGRTMNAKAFLNGYA